MGQWRPKNSCERASSLTNAGISTIPYTNISYTCSRVTNWLGFERHVCSKVKVTVYEFKVLFEKSSVSHRRLFQKYLELIRMRCWWFYNFRQNEVKSSKVNSQGHYRTRYSQKGGGILSLIFSLDVIVFADFLTILLFIIIYHNTLIL